MEKTLSNQPLAQTRRRPRKVSFGAIFVYFLCAVVAVVTLFPFLWMVIGSFKTAAEIAPVSPKFASADVRVAQLCRGLYLGSLFAFYLQFVRRRIHRNPCGASFSRNGGVLAGEASLPWA